MQSVPETHGGQPAHSSPKCSQVPSLWWTLNIQRIHIVLANCFVVRLQGWPDPQLGTGGRSWGTSRGPGSGPHIPPSPPACSAGASPRLSISWLQFWLYVTEVNLKIVLAKRWLCTGRKWEPHGATWSQERQRETGLPCSFRGSPLQEVTFLPPRPLQSGKKCPAAGLTEVPTHRSPSGRA